MFEEEYLKTFYKTNYIYPTYDPNKHEQDEDKPTKVIGVTSLPFLRNISINSNQTIYSSPLNSLSILNTNQGIYKHINSTINQKMIEVYKNKIKTTIKWKKVYDTVRNKLRISPSRRQSTDERLFKKTTFIDKSKDCNIFTLASNKPLIRNLGSQKLLSASKFHWVLIDFIDTWKPDVRECNLFNRRFIYYCWKLGIYVWRHGQ